MSGSWGPMILGHADPEVIAAVRDKAEKRSQLRRVYRGRSGACRAELRNNISHIEMIRMVNSGTEAVMSALRLARGYTRRDKIIKFEGCYHGHSDAMLGKGRVPAP